MKNKINLRLFWMISWILLALSLIVWNITGLSSWYKSLDTIIMFGELAAIFIVTLVINKCVNRKRSLLILLVSELAIFCYLHCMLLPVIVNAIYFLFILSIGYVISRFVKSEPTIWLSFAWGISFIIILECLMSIGGIGSNRNFLIGICLIGTICLIITVGNFREESKLFDFDINFYRDNALAIAIIFTVFSLLIGRCNLAIDYDGLWYGLRSEYILNAGSGIYERIMAISIPNTYPKGYELLTLPLTLFPSYAFRLTFNIFIGLLIVCASFAVIKKINKDAPLIVTAVMSSIPGIMSMCTTMKQDSITLLLQILMLYYAIDFAKNINMSNFWIITALYILSLNMKTTALVFSSAVYFLVFLFALVKIKRIKVESKNIWLMLTSLMVTGLLCLRTYLLCGYPYTSLLNGVWQKLGLSTYEPYVISQPTESIGIKEILTKDGLLNALKKFVVAFVAPFEFDGIITTHLRLAWGTSLILAVLIFVLMTLLTKKCRLSIEKKLILGIYCLVWIFSGYSIASLEKNDGNYYMLLYFLSVVMMASIIDFSAIKKRNMIIFLIPVVIGNLFIFGMTGWAGASKFSQVSLENKGYYDHTEEFKQRFYSEGKQEIYDYFSGEDVSRVLAFGDLENTNRLPYLVENAIEIYPRGGSQYFSDYKSFKYFLELTDTSHIYWDNSYNGYIPMLKVYIYNLIKESYVKDIIICDDNYIFALNMECPNDEYNIDLEEIYIRNIYNKYEVIDGCLYNDGFLGKSATIRFAASEKKYVTFSIWNTDKLENEEITIQVGEQQYIIKLGANDLQECTIELPLGISDVQVIASDTFIPENGDERELSVVLSIVDEM